jgi:hypothetical protein
MPQDYAPGSADGGIARQSVDMVRWGSAFDAAGAVLNNTSLGRVWPVPSGIGVNLYSLYFG